MQPHVHHKCMACICFCYYNSYKAVLISLITLPRLSGIRNIQDLAKAAEQNSISCYIYKGPGFQEILLESDFVS